MTTPRTVAQFTTGTNLSRPTQAALEITGDFYFSCFVNWTSGTSLAGKFGSWAISIASGFFKWTVVDSLATTVFITHPTPIVVGTWYFLEVYHFHSGGGDISIAMTPVSASAPSNWITPVFVSNNPLAAGTDFVLGLNFNGQLHSVCLMNRIPSTAERAILFNAGYGREFWEIRGENRAGIAGFWSLKETTGSRFDRSGNLLHLTANGAVASNQRSIDVIADYHLAAPKQSLRRLLAATAVMQEWTRLFGETATMESIFIDYQPAEDEEGRMPWPFCLIYATGSTATLPASCPPSGTAEIFVEDQASEVDDLDRRTLFANRVGRLVEEIHEVSRRGGYLLVTQASMTEDITRSSKDDVNYFYMAVIQIEWGLAE